MKAVGLDHVLVTPKSTIHGSWELWSVEALGGEVQTEIEFGSGSSFW